MQRNRSRLATHFFLVVMLVTGLALATGSMATVHLNDDFRTFQQGSNLVGQVNWNEEPGISTLPLQVTNGVVLIPDAQTVDNQDAYKSLGAVIPAPGSGTVTVYSVMTVALQSATAIPPFTSPAGFFCLNGSTNAAGINSLNYFRLAARTNDASTYALGVQVSTQAEDPLTFGAGLSYGGTNVVVVENNMLGDTNNCFARIFLNPTSNVLTAQTAYLIHPLGAGAVAPTGVGSAVFEQSAIATLGNSGVTIGHVVVADTFAEALAALAILPPNSWATGVNGKWEDGSKWSSGSAPSTKDQDDRILHGGGPIVTIDSTTSGSFPGTMTINNLVLGSNTLQLINAGTNIPLNVVNNGNTAPGGLLTISNSTLVLDDVFNTNSFFIGGQVELDSGWLVATNDSLVVGSVGQITVNGGILIGREIVVGGRLTVNGGLIDLFKLSFGSRDSFVVQGAVWLNGGELDTTNSSSCIIGGFSSGQMTVSNGVFRASTLSIGTATASGTFTLAGGSTEVTSSNLAIAGVANSTGTVWMTGGTLLATNGFSTVSVGLAGSGQMTVSGGVASVTGLIVGNSASGHGALTCAGGAVNVYNNMTVGNCSLSGFGNVSVSSGTLAVTNASHTAVLEIRDGSVTVSSNASLLVDILVVTNTSCVAQLNRQPGSTVTIGTTNLAPNGDVDNDGLPNAWELQYGFDPFDPTGVNGGAGDPDGDHLNNHTEYLIGTDPHNASDPFRITDIHRESNDIRVTWQFYAGFPSTIHKLDASDNLGFMSNTFVVGGGVNVNFFNGIASTNQVDVGGATNIPARFYRVRWESPP